MAALRKTFPRENFIYVFDRSHAPYGNRSAKSVRRRALKISKMLADKGVKMIVIACNTATNAAIEYLRRELPEVPFVGVEPPIKQAARESRGGRIVVLTTRLTAKQEKFKRLKYRCSECDLTVVPLATLAYEVESHFSDLSELKGRVHEILSPYADAESVVLGCTHYYYLAPHIAACCPGAKIYDACSGVAERVRTLLDGKENRARRSGWVRYVYV